MTRGEHLAWCKKRALAELARGGTPTNAWASMLSDMQKHDETRDHLALELGMMMLASGQLSSVQAMKKFIEDFN